MRLSPHHQAKYVSFYEALKGSNIPADLVPSDLNDFYIWDKQMFHIFSRLFQKVNSIKYEYDQLPNEILRFSNYKDEIDATKYGVWSIEIEDSSQLLAYSSTTGNYDFVWVLACCSRNLPLTQGNR